MPRQVAPKPPPDLGERMRMWMENAGKQAEDVHKATGVAKSHISNVLNGNKAPALGFFLVFCKAIDTPPGTVLGSDVLQRDLDFVRLAHRVRQSIGLEGLNWLASLSEELANLAMERGREAVAYAEAHPDTEPRNAPRGRSRAKK